MLAKRMPAADFFFREQDGVATVSVIRNANDPRIVTDIKGIARIAVRSLTTIRMSGRHTGLINMIRTK